MKNKEETQLTRCSGHAIRLSVWEWLVAAGIIIVLAVALPPVWRGLEDFSPSVDYRIPYDFSEDYWLFEQWCRSVCDQGKTLVIGDSVIWGHYVDRDQTLSHIFNDLAGGERFINLGLDGSHPMALLGLIKYFGKAIIREKIILHMNLLWLSSQEADLQTEKEFHFNHPRLVPQFKPQIPCYAASASVRIGIVLERLIPVLKLIRHWQVTCYENTDLQLWTVENPYANPLARISFQSSVKAEERKAEARSKSAGSQALQSLPWVEFETSLQWGAFQRLIELIKSRGNEVLVVVGPLNEHVLNPDSRKIYRELLKTAESRLAEMNISYSLLPLLPSHLYADTSHPLPEGYAVLAEYIWSRLR